MRASRIINTDEYPLFRKSPVRSRQTLIMPEVRRNGKGGKTTAVVNKIKPRTTFSPGHEPVKFQNNYRQVQGRSQYYFEEVPRPRPPPHLPYQNWESGPDGIRT